MEDMMVLFHFKDKEIEKVLKEIAEIIVIDFELGCAFIKTEKEKSDILELPGVVKVIKKSEV